VTALWRRLSIQPQVIQCLLDHLPLQDDSDDHELPTSVLRAVVQVEIKDALA
jgi:hypothetical protein